MKRFVAAACFACALPAFGQDVREQLVASLHEACVANVDEALTRSLQRELPQPVDSAKFCACADERIRQDRILDAVAKLPESERRPASKPAVALEGNYFFDGLQCYSRIADWPRPAEPDEGGRSKEEVMQAIEKQKGFIYQAYRRAQKSDPWLSGEVIFEFTIEPDGRVSAVKVLSSNLQNENLLAELKSRFLTMNLPVESVPKLITTYPIEFRPL